MIIILFGSPCRTQTQCTWYYFRDSTLKVFHLEQVDLVLQLCMGTRLMQTQSKEESDSGVKPEKLQSAEIGFSTGFGEILLVLHYII